jgi:hypothetical protein
MRRVQAIALILALLAMPIVLLAQSGLDGAACDRMCCLPHGHHAAQPQNEGSHARDEEMTCHHSPAGHTMKCQMRVNHPAISASPVAPIPPAMLSAGVDVAAPSFTTEIQTRNLEVALPGFDSPPFEPPRL